MTQILNSPNISSCASISAANDLFSIASIILSLKEKSINFFRNEQRPLYYTQNNTTTIIASTYDILKRSGFENITKTLPCVDYKLKDNIITNKLIREPLEDLQ